MTNRNIAPILILIVVLPIALYLGVGSATDGLFTAIKVVAVLGLGVCFLLGSRIWLMMYFLGGLGLTLMVPGRPTTALMGQALFLGFAVLLLLMRRLPVRFRFNEMHFWAGLFLLCIIQVYLRHPVGVNLIGSNSVGGRPYVLLAVAMAAMLLVSFMRVPARELRWAMYLVISAGLISFGLTVFGYFVSAVGVFYGAANPEASDTADYGEVVDEGEATRMSFLSRLANVLSRTVSSFISPIRACFSLWLPVVVISFVAAGMSGYRSAMAMVGLTYLCGIYYRNGIRGLALSAFCGLFALGVLAMVNANFPLPPNIQRAMTFLPGTWEGRYVNATENSTEWRREMWTEALTSDRYIDNKWIGDGLGISADKLRRAEALKESGGRAAGGWDAQREAMMLTGSYHSGPVQTIRTIGYLGLIIMMAAKWRLAVHAHRLINRCRGTEWFPVALFFCIPVIWNPLFFFFVFGTFKSGALSLFGGIAIVSLLRANLPLADIKAEEKYIPMAVRRGRSPQGMPA